MREPTSDEVRALFKYMEGATGAKVVAKADSGTMQAIAWFLDTMGIMDRETFMQRYTTTIPTVHGVRIFMPYEPGSDGSPLWNQIGLCAHEHQHALQARDDGEAKFSVRYLVDKSARAQYEAHAMRCSVELHWWRYGGLPDMQPYAEKIRAYGCGDAEVQFIRSYLDASALTIEAGGVISEAAQLVVAWLDTHAPDVRQVQP